LRNMRANLILAVFLTATGPAYPQGGPKSTNTTSPPARGAVWLRGDDIHVGSEVGKGGPSFLQIFVFDGKTRTAAEVGGAVMTAQDNPIPITFAPANSITSPGGSISAKYSNVVLSFGSPTERPAYFPLGEEVTTDGAELAIIQLAVGRTKDLFVSPFYVVFPDELRNVQGEGPFAQLVLSPAKEAEGCPSLVGSTVIISRNGTEVAKGPLLNSGEYAIGLKYVKRSADTISYRVEGKGEKCSYRATLSFPVTGSTPNLVRYLVRLGSR
jgi:hypothetical protein